MKWIQQRIYWFTVIVFLFGYSCGTMVMEHYYNKALNKIGVMECSELRSEFRAWKVNMPRFNEDHLEGFLHADTFVSDGSKIDLTNPVILRFEEDGVTVKSKVTGDFGEITLDKDGDFVNVRVWGNTKVWSKAQVSE